MDIPSVREFVEMIHDAGAEIYACKASVDMFHLDEDIFCEQLDGIISVWSFMKNQPEQRLFLYKTSKYSV